MGRDQLCRTPVGRIHGAGQPAGIRNGRPPVGFLNPALYGLASGPNFTNFFHDVTKGNDTWKDSPSKFYAATGYDLCTGLGTMNGTNLINALAPPMSGPAFLSTTPTASGLTLSWSSLPGRSYQLQCAMDLSGNTWMNYGPAIVASGPVVTVTDTPAGSHRFYRVALLPH